MAPDNRVILTGKVATSAQRHYRPDGSPVIQFSLELDGTEDVSFEKGRSLIHIVALGNLAETDSNLFQNGQSLRVEGRLKQRHWKTPEGRNRSRMEVVAAGFSRLE